MRTQKGAAEEGSSSHTYLQLHIFYHFYDLCKYETVCRKGKFVKASMVSYKIRHFCENVQCLVFLKSTFLNEGSCRGKVE